MSVPAWPATLPQNMLAQGYKGALPNNQLRQPMDVGPAKVRCRGTVAVTPVSGRILVTPTELATLITFYETTLLDGTLRFSWVQPEDGTTAVEMRFTESPTWSWVDGYFEVALSLEILK
jgi:hypothetical protein